MKKRDKIIYWITTGLVSVGMLLSAGMYLTRNANLMDSFSAIGIPLYLVPLLGIAKLLGAVALVVPSWSILKEWAYAGFTIMFVGAAWVHVATGTSPLAPLLFLILLGTSYVFRWRLTANQSTSFEGSHG